MRPPLPKRSAPGPTVRGRLAHPTPGDSPSGLGAYAARALSSRLVLAGRGTLGRGKSGGHPMRRRATASSLTEVGTRSAEFVTSAERQREARIDTPTGSVLFRPRQEGHVPLAGRSEPEERKSISLLLR